MSHDNGNKNTPKPRHRWNPFVQLRSASPGSGRRPIQRAADMADLREALPDWYLTPDQERTARSRMVRLCEHMDSLLETGIRRRQISSTCCRFVVMGVWAIEVDVAWRRVSAGPIGEDGAFSPTPRPFEVGIPLEEPDWIPSLLTRLGVGFVGQRDIFMGKALEEEWNRWLCHTLHNFLRHEPRFQRLRHDALSLGTAIPRDILGMAMATRARPLGRLLDSHLLNCVWQHESLFRQTARENPQLLPLVAALVMERDLHLTIPDPVQALKHHFRTTGVSEAGWRYLAHHGARIFRVPWSIHGGDPALEVATLCMQILDGAGLPPVPPPTIADAIWRGPLALWASRTIAPLWEAARFPRTVLRAGLLEADRRRRAHCLGDFWIEFIEVCEWASSPFTKDEAVACKGDWRRLVRCWQRYQEEEAALWNANRLRWKCSISRFTIGNLAVVPLESSEDLVSEGLAMRNCIETYEDRCVAGEYEAYSVRDRSTKRSRGCIGITRSPDGRRFSIDQVKGYANRPPSIDVLHATQALMNRLSGFAAMEDEPS